MAQKHDGHGRQENWQVLDESFGIGDYTPGSAPQAASIYDDAANALVISLPFGLLAPNHAGSVLD